MTGAGDQDYGTVWPAASPYGMSVGGTDGSNFPPDTICGYLCTAEPGYDGATGLGTPNGLGGF